MGYSDVTDYKLIFEKRDGLEVTVEGLSTGDLLDVMGTVAKMPDSKATEKEGLSNPALRESMEEVMGKLAGSLVEWNVEDRHGTPVPKTLAGVKSLKLGLVMDIVTAWVSAQTDVDAPLPGASSDGGTTARLEASIPMTPSPGS